MIRIVLIILMLNPCFAEDRESDDIDKGRIKAYLKQQEEQLKKTAQAAGKKYLEAHDFYEKGEFNSALVELSAALKIHPRHKNSLQLRKKISDLLSKERREQQEKWEEEERQRELAALKLVKEDGWGEMDASGFQMQLVAAQEKYVFGSPMRFHVFLKNSSKQVKGYDSQSLMHPVFSILHSEGGGAFVKSPMFSTSGGSIEIEPEEVHVLFADRDLEWQYAFTKSGAYTIQFPGWPKWGWPKSNALTFEIEEGEPRIVDLIYSKIATKAPEKCHLYAINRGKESSLGSVEIYAPGGPTARGSRKSLGQTLIAVYNDNKGDIDPEFKYLGVYKGAYLYYNPSESIIKSWPNLAAEVKELLGL